MLSQLDTILLDLFSSVIESGKKTKTAYVSTRGFAVLPSVGDKTNDVVKYAEAIHKDGEALNKTLFDSIGRVATASEIELAFEQVKHYMSTYGTGFTGEVYIPVKSLTLPASEPVRIKSYGTLTTKQAIDRLLDLIESGVALKSGTVHDVIYALVELGYVFTSVDTIKNKEASVRIADMFGVYPTNPEERLRYIVYKLTGETLLIKNKNLIDKIQNNSVGVDVLLMRVGIESLAPIFNRFKPLFLAMKRKAPKQINRLSKLSKRLHEGMPTNPLNESTYRMIRTNEQHWLDNATPFALVRAMDAIARRVNGQDVFMHRVRNGKGYVRESMKEYNTFKLLHNFEKISRTLQEKIGHSFEGKTFYIPDTVNYAVPTSEKKMVGNFPEGTSFVSKNIAVGVYWKNDYGVCDYDLSALTILGKVGWDASLCDEKRNLIHSGDVTSAPNGAVEYVHAREGLSEPALIVNDIYDDMFEDFTVKYDIIIGQGHDEVDADYMLDPNNLIASIPCETSSKEMCFGIVVPVGNKQHFQLYNYRKGGMSVSSNTKTSRLTNEALVQQCKYMFGLKDLIGLMGGEVVTKITKDAIDLSPNKLDRDTILKLLM